MINIYRNTCSIMMKDSKTLGTSFHDCYFRYFPHSLLDYVPRDINPIYSLILPWKVLMWLLPSVVEVWENSRKTLYCLLRQDWTPHFFLVALMTLQPWRLWFFYGHLWFAGRSLLVISFRPMKTPIVPYWTDLSRKTIPRFKTLTTWTYCSTHYNLKCIQYLKYITINNFQPFSATHSSKLFKYKKCVVIN